jgi:hypothetical protein
MRRLWWSRRSFEDDTNMFGLGILIAVIWRVTTSCSLIEIHFCVWRPFFFPLTLEPQFWPWPTSMKLSVSLRFIRSQTFGRTPWAGDQLVARPLPVQKHRKTHIHTQTLNIHALSGIRTHDPGFWESEDSACLRPLVYSDRLEHHVVEAEFCQIKRRYNPEDSTVDIKMDYDEQICEVWAAIIRFGRETSGELLQTW